MQMFLLLCCVNSKQKAKQYTENLSAKLQNSNQNSTFSWVSLRWYGTLEYGDFHEKFNFLTIQDLRKTFEHLSKTF